MIEYSIFLIEDREVVCVRDEDGYREAIYSVLVEDGTDPETTLEIHYRAQLMAEVDYGAMLPWYLTEDGEIMKTGRLSRPDGQGLPQPGRTC